MAKSKVFCITRDIRKLGPGIVGYRTWPYRHFPKIINGRYQGFRSQDFWHYFCKTTFEKLTGITLAPGQREKYRLVKQE